MRILDHQTRSWSFRNKRIGSGVKVVVRLFWVLCLLAVLMVSREPASAQTALQLFHEMQFALGGAQNIMAIHDFDETVRADTWNPQGRPLGIVRKRVRWIKPNYLRIDQSGSYDSYVLFFDGNGGWEIMPDRSIRELSGGEMTFAQNYLHGIEFNIWLADLDPQALLTSPAPNSLIVTFGDDKSRSIAITLDPFTHLPIKQAATSNSDPNRPVPAYTIPDQWRTIEGVKYPGRIRNFHEGKMLAEITLETMQANLGIKSDILSAKPVDLKPVISGK